MIDHEKSNEAASEAEINKSSSQSKSSSSAAASGENISVHKLKESIVVIIPAADTKKKEEILKTLSESKECKSTETTHEKEIGKTYPSSESNCVSSSCHCQGNSNTYTYKSSASKNGGSSFGERTYKYVPSSNSYSSKSSTYHESTRCGCNNNINTFLNTQPYPYKKDSQSSWNYSENSQPLLTNGHTYKYTPSHSTSSLSGSYQNFRTYKYQPRNTWGCNC